jgi:ABC-type amino acid transport substrate-binding protein
LDKRRFSSAKNGNKGGRPSSLSAVAKAEAQTLFYQGYSLQEISKKTQISLSHLYRIKNNWEIKNLRVGVNFEIQKPEEISLGDLYDLRILQLLCFSAKIRPRIIYQPFQSILTAISTGEVDLSICNLSATDERKKTNCFSEVYGTQVRNDIHFFVNKDSNYFHLNQVFKGNFGVLSRSLHDEFLSHKKVFRIKRFPNEYVLAEGLIENKVDCILADQGSLPESIMMRIRKIESSFRLDYGLKPSIAFNLNEVRLGEQFNSTIDRMKSSGILDLIYKLTMHPATFEKKESTELKNILNRLGFPQILPNRL